eukprot:334091_1
MDAFVTTLFYILLIIVVIYTARKLTTIIQRWLQWNTKNDSESNLHRCKSMKDFSKLIRKIGHGFRTLDQFDDSLNQLENILNTFNQTNAFNKYHWITNNNQMFIRNIIFGHIQNIGNIFIRNEQKNVSKSLKTDIKNYQRFFQNLSKLIKSYSFNLFTHKQIKIIQTLINSVLNYKNVSQLSIIEKQNHLLSQKQNQCKTVKSNIISKLRSKLSKQRLNRCEMVLQHRTDRVILVLDQCYDIRNQSAMLRSAELFGIQNVWIVRPINYKNMKIYNSVSRRSQMWLTLKYFDSCLECINVLEKEREENEREIWVMDISKDAMELCPKIIDEYKNKIRIFPKNIAIVMGKEAEGPSEEFLEYCDKKIYLPQFGFCESYNVSVACALGLQKIFSMDTNIRGQMNEIERNKLRYLWYYQLVNDEEIKEEMRALMDETFECNEDIKNINKCKNDFRRDGGKDCNTKKINFKLRKRLEYQRKQNFVSSNS